MRIDSIEIFQASLPLKEPWQTSFGIDTSTDSILVRMSSGKATGWGEATPLKLPTYGPEYTAGVFHVVRDLLAPLLVGRDVETGDALQELLAVYRGNSFAKASLDLAWWDLEAQRHQLPLWELIGGVRPVVEVGEAFSIQKDLDELVSRVGDALSRGYTRVKLKFGPGSEGAVVRRVREAFPDLALHIDCNGAYSLEAAPMFRELDPLDLAMIEQPLHHDDLVDHAALQRTIETPICLDESIISPRAARQAIALSSCRWINIKPGRVGGITPALQIERICRDAGTPCWIGSMLDSAVGTSFGIALATLPAVAYPSDLLPSRRFFARDLTTEEVELCGAATIAATDRPGIGVEVDAGYLREVTVEHAVVT